jgi:hypothetical protein
VADAVVAAETVRAQWSFSRMSVEPSLRRKCDCGGGGECEECKAEGAMLQRASRATSEGGSERVRAYVRLQAAEGQSAHGTIRGSQMV